MGRLIEEASLSNPNLKAFAIINLAFPRGLVNEQTQAIVREDYLIYAPDRTADCAAETLFRHGGQGLSALEAKPKNADAIAELQGLLTGIAAI